ncbi:pentatricopeptide repeat domain-containing protein 3, mitochondrial [Nematolebias whitei]|uniref:pentatricopeptide repeat domain-containing protein 3, mitochondrial n=1 Tax=Nematolebias whitei TaxID=451745 RepID=UPI00189C4EA3|nr:pentatricopeptide repeat domain-containing protein 3, mitochondrial [Nematolebias whitei]
MAAPCRHLGRYVQRNGRFLPFNLEHLLGSRSFSLTPAAYQSAEVHQESAASVIIPKKKTWSKEAVLEALASTVNRDPTVYPYQFQDDAFLSPRTPLEFRLFSLSQESGRSAAKYFIKNNPQLFTNDIAEPHIPCLMPETAFLQLEEVSEEVSEEALKVQIHLRKVAAAVDMFDQLLQAGTVVSMETAHELLDLLCLYGDKDPVQDGAQQKEDTDEAEKDMMEQTSEPTEWRDGNNAERIFNLLPNRDTLCYSALIRGMVKYRAYTKAFSMYKQLLRNGLSGDVHIFNALFSAIPYVEDTSAKKWGIMNDLLNQMSQMSVRPNLLTFNSVLKALRRCGHLAKTFAPQILNEMKALGIAPSLATYDHILACFSKTGFSKFSNMNILQRLMSELEGCSFTCQDPDDVNFFANSMKICLVSKELDLAYKVHSLVEVGENWRLLGNPSKQNLYYCRFFTLLCLMEHIDVVLKWYQEMVPSMFYPSVQCQLDLLHALDTDNRLDLLPMIWKDIKTLGYSQVELVEELLSLMARDQHSPEVQEAFAACALDILRMLELKPDVVWTSFCLSHITSLLLRVNLCDRAWEVMQLFRTRSLIPSEAMVNNFLSMCQSSGNSQRAVELVQLSAALCLSSAPRLAAQVLDEFELSEEQRSILSDLDAAEKLPQQEDV